MVEAAHAATVDVLLDAFPGATVIAAENYDERDRAARYGAARYVPKTEPAKKTKRVPGQQELEY